MGRARGSFRHHEPYLLCKPEGLRARVPFDELPAGSSRLVCERLTTLVDGNVLLGSVAALRTFDCADCDDLPVVLFVYPDVRLQAPKASTPEDWGVGGPRMIARLPAGST
jgi:hypothetical protein